MKSTKSHYPVYVVLAVAVLFSLVSPELASASTFCDSARYIADVTIPDGSVFQPGAAFTKTWRLANSGSCSWTTAYSLVYISGDRLASTEIIPLPAEVKPGASVDLSVNMTAPAVAGHYRSSWKLKNASGALFGLGSSANQEFWADISVVQANSAVYDFTTNAGYASWLSGAGQLTYPAASADYRGYAMPVNAPHLEDGSTDTLPGLLTVPQNKYDGYIQATYPELQIQPGDHLQTLVGCEYGATSCYVTFRIDVIAPAGRKTLWSWKEKYDAREYRADLDLTSYAGQKVKFVFMLLASGDSTGDRAIWGAPRIIRGGGGLSPLPTFTPTPTPFAPPPTVTLTDCDKASLVADVTAPFGTPYSPGVAFTKTWRLKNIGSCTWTTAYSLIYYGGEQMGAPSSVPVPSNVAPGQTVDLSVNMVAPPDPGTYTGWWALRDPSGLLFGMFVQGPSAFMVNIDVTGASASQTGYDFAANYCSARWIAGGYSLPCPGTDREARGAVLRLDAPKLEDGSIDTSPGLLALPQNKTDGYIQGEFPAIAIQAGDHFESNIGCQYGATDCYVTFRLDYLTPGGTTRIFWSWKERYEGKFYHASVDLTPLAGQSLRLVLTVLASGPASGDRALWGSPHIVHATPGTPLPPPVSPLLVPTPDIYKLFMIDSSHGWALGSSYVLRTGDGGQTWYNVTMPGVSLNLSAVPIFFSNATTGWVVARSPDDNTALLYSTTDGGASWSHHNAPAADGYLQFVDSAHGFLLSGQGSGMNKQAVTLYATSNGGETWVRNFAIDPDTINNDIPFSGHKNGMFFRDSARGWISGDIPMDGFVYLYTTTNGGVHWSQVSLAFPAGYAGAYISTSVPQFFGSSDAILLARINSKTGSQDLFVYTSHNGGASWTLSPVSAGPGKNTDFVSVRDGFSWDWSGVFHVTHNSGASWSTVTPNINFGDSVRDMDFVSTATGWTLDNDSNGLPALYRTVNGGSTWTLLYGITPTATPTPAPPSTTVDVPVVTAEGGSVRSDGTLLGYPNVGDDENNASSQGFLSFDMSAVPAGATLTAVRLDFASYDVLNDPFNLLGPMRLYGEDYGSLDAGDFYTGTAPAALMSWVDPGRLSAKPGDPPDGGLLNYLQSRVGSPRAQFRVQFSDKATNNDGIVDMLRLGPALKFIVTYTGPLPGTATPVAPAVTNVTVNATVPDVCTTNNQVLITAALTTNAAVNLTYHWEIGGDSVQGVSPDTQLSITGATATTVNFPYYPYTPHCGNYYIKFIVTAPNEISGMTTFSLFPPTITPGPTFTPMPTPTAGPTQDPAWLVYANPIYGFQIGYPPAGSIVNPSDNGVYIRLPYVQGTNLVSKYVQITASNAAADCSLAPAETVVLNGKTYLKQTSSGAIGAGRILDLATYATTSGSTCVKLMFVLQSGDPGNFSPPVPAFDKAAESAVFEPMLNTFVWLPATPTPTASATPQAVDIPSSTPAAGCDQLTYVSDVTIPDGTTEDPNTAFTKTWRIQNTGTCAWTSPYALVFTGGDALAGPATLPLTGTVNPGDTLDLSVDLQAPSSAGDYSGNWSLRNAAGIAFGLLTVKIHVPAASSFAIVAVTYDIATWTDTASASCPQVTAHITTNGAGTVQYHWTADSGGTSPLQALTFASAGTQDVSEQLSPAAPTPGQDQWAGLFVDVPNNQDFGHIAITPCTGP